MCESDKVLISELEARVDELVGQLAAAEDTFMRSFYANKFFQKTLEEIAHGHWDQRFSVKTKAEGVLERGKEWFYGWLDNNQDWSWLNDQSLPEVKEWLRWYAEGKH